VHDTPAFVYVGVIVIVPLIGELVEFVPTKTGIVFVPDETKPIA